MSSNRAHTSPRELVAHAIEHATHLLPSQRPLEAFVHHNTLHAFEHLSFEQGVAAGAETFGARAYLSEEAFRAAWASGRILDRDLDAVLNERVPDELVGAGLPALGTRELVRRLLLLLPADTSGPALAWRLSETDTLSALPPDLPRDARERLLGRQRIDEALPNLWQACNDHVLRTSTPLPILRPRDTALRDRHVDPDLLVHPVLIRWCAAYLDHGQSYWPMPERDRGFYHAMLSLLLLGGLPLRDWTAPLRARARELLHERTDPLDCVVATLQRLGVPHEAYETVVTATLLALPGWPGMFVQLNARPDLAPGPVRPTSLVEFLAVRLLLDEAALHAGDDHTVEVKPEDEHGRDTWRLFQTALLVGLRADEARRSHDPLDRLSALLGRWHPTARGAIWQLAFERRLRITTLDAVINHQRRVAQLQPAPVRAQVVTCIDDRTESFRRHLEEVDAGYATYAWAGFFGVPMAYRGLSEAHHRPLCPPLLVPKHLVEERVDPADEAEWRSQSARRARSGRLAEATHVGGGTLLRGAALSVAGLASLLPMTLRLLAPHHHAELSARRHAVRTVLTLAFDPNEPELHGLQLGFHLPEMVGIVGGVLRGMGLVTDFAELVLFLGHGSSSMNNPHKAAYDCGACGGGPGGPNARAFAQLANRPDVRAALREQGVQIPDTTWFVGGFQNTASDEITLYDLHLVPSALRAALTTLQNDLDEARRRDAHERCRRFHSAPLDLSTTEALEHVQHRVADIAQPRPECGHATNALCLVGRRAWSRGLNLDRRAFLNSYDSTRDPDASVLESLLATVGPVVAGINLEYYFSFVDPDRYGCNTKLPHNVTGLLGVMDGHSSDLRTGLPWQMVELHEPVRLLVIVEATPERLTGILQRQAGLRALVERRWILLAAFDPEACRAWFYDEQGFVPYTPESTELPTTPTSLHWYRGERGHLPPATVLAGCAGQPALPGAAA